MNPFVSNAPFLKGASGTNGLSEASQNVVHKKSKLLVTHWHKF